MKKLVSLLLSVCMLSITVMLTACGDEEHTHTYKTEWSKDATYHWHACEGDKVDRGCDDVADKAEHTWNDGEITTEATAEADGVKTFTCTVCGQTKTESVTVTTTITKDEWIFNFTLDNYTINCTEYSGEDTENIVFKVTKNAIFERINNIDDYFVLKDDIWYSLEYTSDGYVGKVDKYGGSEPIGDEIFGTSVITDLGNIYDMLTYNEAEKFYYVTDDYREYRIYFENGNITGIRIDGTDYYQIMTVSDIGTTTIEIPDFDIYTENNLNRVTMEEWETSFAFDYSFLQTKIFEADLSGEAEFIITEDGIRYVETYGYTEWYACYMEKVDDGWLVYEGQDSGSSIEDIKSYSKEFYTLEEAANYLFTEDAYTVYTSQFVDCYEKFRYDEESQSYVADSIVLSEYRYDEKLGYADAEFSEISISFTNGRIEKVSYTETLSYSNGETQVDTVRVEFYYDAIEIIFPEATEVTQ